MENKERNYIISGVAVVAIALIGFFFYNPGSAEVAEADNTAMEVVVVAQPDADQGVEGTTEDKSETVPAVEMTEAVSTEDANAE